MPDAAFDEDGLRERASVAQSDARRREKERASRDAYRIHQDALRAAFAAGELTMAEYAKQGREAGIAASEIGAALMERAAAEKRMEQKVEKAKSDAIQADETGKPSELAAALSAKAQGLECLRRNEHADAAEAFSDAASLAEGVAAHTSCTAQSDEALKLRVACLLNEALCRLKLEEWATVEGVCSSVLALDASSAKALYRRGAARLKLSQPAAAVEDLSAAATLTPADRDVRKLLAEAMALAPAAPPPLPPPPAADTLEVGGAITDAVDGNAAAPAPAAAVAGPLPAAFVPASAGFHGFRAGYHFKFGAEGLGYYLDASAPMTCLMAPASLPMPPKLRVPDVTKRTHCYLELSIEGRDAGRLTLQLFDDLVPKTTANFRALLRGTAPAPDGSRPAYRYQGSPFHRVAKGFIVQGGDVVAGDGTGSVSGLEGGELFEDESFAIPHARPGVLSMANQGANTNGCQFFLTLAAVSVCDGKHVAFGRLVAGWALLRRIENLSIDKDDRPLERVIIRACGELSADEASRFDRTNEDVNGISGPLDMAGEALLKAASEGDLPLMRNLLSRGVNVDTFGCVTAPVLPSPTGVAILPASAAERGASAPAPTDAAEEQETIECAALTVAARMGDVDMLTGLLGAGADADLVDSSGRVALHWAVLSGHAPCVDALLAGGAQVAARDATGKIPLHLAAMYGRLDCLRRILAQYGDEQKASAANDVDAEASGLTALHLAAAGDHAGCISELLGAGASLDQKAAAELTPLHIAAGQGALMALSTLLAARADVGIAGERSGRTPLHTACEHARAMAVGALLAARADVAIQDAKGSSPLHWACKAGSYEAVACLLGARAQPDELTRLGSSAVHLACEASSPQCVALLLRAKAAADACGEHGIRPLHAACAVGSVECLQLLLSQRADPHAPLRVEGHTSISTNLNESHEKFPLYLATEKGHTAIVSILLAAKADIDALAVTVTELTTTKTSPLWAARRADHDAVAELLVAAGASEHAELIHNETGHVV